MSKNGLHGPQNLESKLIRIDDLKNLKNKKNTTEIAKYVAQRICYECIEEYYKIKSRLKDE